MLVGGGGARAGLCLFVALTASGCGGEGRCFDREPVQLEIRAVSVLPFDDPDPIEGAEVCLVEPVECGCATTKESGFARLDVPSESEILVTITKPMLMTNIVQRVAKDEDLSSDVRITRRSDFEAVGMLIEDPVDPSMGHVGIGLLPPPGGSAAGARVTLHGLDDGSEREAVYFDNLVPKTDRESTDEKGIAFFVNVPPGDYEVRSPSLEQCAAIESGLERRAEDGTLRAMEVEVRRDAITQASAVQCDL
ncbi:MAG: carboxypeptidase-like regulatory domain-containing protein [Polyangiales bacterium]